ncbi:uncharacterized membrane protein YcaP (DUF421 family) [Deinococcus metalli]|uniref:DUF421 domain-containing protein n=1 Tax=Deinococcus metalli TaxID=1141878 RepID=A0A7W8NLH8_9DEIO|nr:DUF421 domain-containing protein [Deinococcus metalli]MBB5374734.1 uncharacterized membrane protein YcaP (DUF421 family) [Deinococcus metalli]GHF34100.1 DUF421 domain-containing protein [Deinococcus metalli]
MSAEVQPFDWQRMLLGDTPPVFLLEIGVRTVVVFLWLAFLLRITGKRGLAQLSPLELAIVIALGSAAGDPMFYPEVPLVHAMLVIALVVGLQRGLSLLVIRSDRVEAFIEGEPVELVRGGVLSPPALQAADLSREDLFERLRAQGVRQLGEIQRAYFEQDGNLSVFRHAHGAPPGLPIVPPWDLEPPPALPVGQAVSGPVACLTCGQVRQIGGPLPACPCGGETYTPATTDPFAEAGAPADEGDHAPGSAPQGGSPAASSR